MAGKMVKRLTVREIMGSQPGLLPQVADMIAAGVKKQNPEPVKLCRILGVVNKAKPGFSKTTETEFVRFVGEVVGINLFTGERVQSGAVILPGAAENAIYGALGQLNDAGQAERTVEFGIEIAVRYDEKSATKYVFDVSSLVEAKASAPLLALLEKAGVDKPALPAPGVETPPAPPPAEEKKPETAARRR